MTCRALTEHDQILAHRLQAEVAVERRDTHDPCRAIACPRGDMIDHVLRQIPVNCLCFLENRDQAGRILFMLAKHILQQRKITAFFHF